MNKIIIAIDGHSSCGKSTLARDLADVLGYTYISSGKMYRAVTLYFIQNDVDIEDKKAVSNALKKIDIRFEHHDGDNLTYLNGRNVESEIISMPVARLVSPVSAISAVRREMVHQQQLMGKAKGMVMDGRDIGTVVFEEAELKIFLTAAKEVRALRRYEELKAKGKEADLDAVMANLVQRDYIDSNRTDSPLRQADDAVVIDNTNLTRKEQLAMVKALVLERVKG